MVAEHTTGGSAVPVRRPIQALGEGRGGRAPLSLFSGATEPSRRWTVEWRSSVRRAGERPSSSSLLGMGDARRAAGMFASGTARRVLGAAGAVRRGAFVDCRQPSNATEAILLKEFAKKMPEQHFLFISDFGGRIC